jgi:RimJ/RimL family protein N-acetyltransferase
LCVLAPRPIRPDDKAALTRGLDCMSDRSVYLRFLSPKPSFSASELRYLTEVDGIDHVALVLDDPDSRGTLMAVGRWVRLEEDPETAEIAITVGDRWQRQGLGTLLARALAAEAARRGVRHFTASISSSNTAARRLLEKASGELCLHRAGTVEDAVIDLPLPEAA